MNRNSLKLLWILPVVLFNTALAWMCNYKSFTGIDDANIYFVYMRNFGNGHGFVYNIGGEKVEGFTSLLWTLLGVLYSLLTQNFEVLLLITNIAIITFILWRIVKYLDNFQNDQRIITPYSLAFIGLLSVIPGFFEWTVLSLLETGLWSALLVLTTLNVVASLEGNKNKLQDLEFNILIFFLIICRPEAMLWGLYFIFTRYLLNSKLHTSYREQAGSLAVSLIVYTITITALIFWRISYFGFPLPNTYYAKVSSGLINNILHGIFYLYRSICDNPIIILSILLPFIALKTEYRLTTLKRYHLLICFGVVIISILIPLVTGGDHFGLSRFIQPTLPIILLCFLLSLQHLAGNLRFSHVAIFLVFASFIPANNIYNNFLHHSSPIAHEWQIATSGRYLGNELNNFFTSLPELPSQGVLVAGGIKYTYKGKTIDLLGLNNVEMAHAKKIKTTDVLKNHASFNKDVFLKQRPDLFWYGSVTMSDEIFKTGKQNKSVLSEFEKRVFKNIQLNTEFRDVYSNVIILDKAHTQYLRIFASNVFLAKLDTNYYSHYSVPFE
ncbi:MAG: hypothetical protein V4642_11025 [Bacteroidota bacterium]